MKYLNTLLLIAAFIFSTAGQKEEKMGNFTISTTAFGYGEVIPTVNTCEGQDISPSFSWSDIPNGTKSFVLTCMDPDAPPGTWVHWVLYDLPGNLTELPEGIAKKDTLDNGAKQGLCWGVSSFSRVGYYGPCPPPGHGYHRYYFTLYALDVESLGLPAKATPKEVEEAMEGHILGKAVIMGRYKRD